ncbi:MFS transporter [Bacillus inaquosorum]|uniref:MFS transporter n=1 Tax=Bacillus inaquosorum TaxID=483913 RepID=UPI002280C14A|nr:MFS transporter [Bacillus inaquosorum]MCY7911075.1 MFS transporter [Bacillus inaquosorum]MCY8859948.1 MFS transporter [Bacillus inaquosorum]MCY8876303.1 MFS transporter [Bacillus inaquosorum]
MKISSNLFKLLSANFFSYWGDSLFFFSLSLYVLNKTNDAKMVSLVTLITIAPKVIFIIFGHVINLRFDNKKLLVVLDILAGLVFIIFSFIESFTNITLFLVFIFIISTVEAFYRIPSRTIITSIEKGNNIDKYHALNNSMLEAVNIITPFISIILYSMSFIGFSGLCFINGISYLAAGIIESRLKIIKSENHEGGGRDSLREALQSFIYLLKSNYFLSLITLIMMINLILGGYNIILLQFSKEFTQTFYSITLMGEGIGGTLSVILYRYFPKKIANLPIYFLIIAFTLLLGVLKIKFFIIIMSVLIGLIVTSFTTNYYSTILKSYNKAHSGAILSLTMSLGLLSMPMGNYVMAFLNSSSHNLIALSIFSIFLFVLFNLWIKSSIKKIQQDSQVDFITNT